MILDLITNLHIVQNCMQNLQKVLTQNIPLKEQFNKSGRSAIGQIASLQPGGLDF